MTPKVVKFTMALLMLTWVLVACRQNETPDTGTPTVATSAVTIGNDATLLPISQNGHVVESSIANPNIFNPVLGNDGVSSTVYSLMYLSLVTLEEFTGRIVPQVASAWTISEDGLVYTFTLREDIFWSDGTPLTAHDVAFTFEAINTDTVASPRRGGFVSVVGWQVVDDFTLQVTLSGLDCTSLTGWGVQGIIPAHVYGGDPENIAGNSENIMPTVTAGPFTFVEYQPDEYVTLAAYDDYYLGRPQIDRWTLRVYAGETSAFNGLRTGEVTWAGVSPKYVSIVEEDMAKGSPMKIRKWFANGYNFVAYNLANPANPQNGWQDLDGDGRWTTGEPPLVQDPHPILGDVNVRRAIAYSIDYAGIMDKVAFGQGGAIASNVWPSIGWAYHPNLDPYQQDLALAQSILEATGWVDTDGDGVRDKNGQPLRLSLMTNAGNEVREDIGFIMEDVLEEIGFDIELEYLDFNVVTAKLLGQTYDMVIMGLGGGVTAPDDSLQFSYVNDVVGRGFNFVSYYNPVVEDNLQKGRAVAGCAEQERAPYYLSNQVEIYNDLPYSFFYVRLANAVWDERLQNFDPNGWSPRYNIQQWYLTAN